MFDSNQWLDASRILIPKTAPSSEIQAVFFNSYTGVGGARDTWQTVDLSSVLPSNAVAIHVTGILIITHGSNAETADLTIYFRRDSNEPSNQNHQCIEAAIGNGQRSTMACWIPLTESFTFDWKWMTASYNGAWPSWSAYGANLQIDAIALNN